MADVPNILDFPNAPLIVTNQTTDRTPAGRTSKDDGGEQVGIARKYSVLDTGQYSGNTTITVNAKNDTHSNEAVLDNITGLMWTRTRANSIGASSNGTLAWDDTAGSDEDVFKYCDQANIANLSGHNDWRVPNILELASILNMEAPNSAPDATAWPVFTTGNYYTSTTLPNSVTFALAVNFTNGTKNGILKTTASAAFVFLCRLGYGR